MKYFGNIGYGVSVEKAPGVWAQAIVQKPYTGDVIKKLTRWEKGEGTNDDLNINNQISVIADAFAYQNFQNIRFIEWMGALWKVTSIDVQRPRLILSIGGVYNGPTT